MLDSHNTSSTDAQRAVVDDAWLEAGQGLARLRFPRKGTDARSDRLFEMARQRVIRNISVGYSIDQVRVVAPMKAGDVAAMPADIRHQGYSTKRSMLYVWENVTPDLPQRYESGELSPYPVEF